MNISKPSQKKRAEKTHKDEKKLTPGIRSHKFSSCMPYDRYAIQPPSHYSVLGDNPEKQNKTKKQDHNQHEKTEE